MKMIVEGPKGKLDAIRKRFRSFGVSFTEEESSSPDESQKEYIPDADKSDKRVRSRRTK